MTGPCRGYADRFEAIAVGDEEPDAAMAAHLEGCPACRGRLAMARAIERALATRPVAAPPDGFTGRVLDRVQHERWRAEQALDIGFNLAIGAGVLLIVAGIAGLAWASGFVAVGVDMTALVAGGVSATLARVAPDMPTVTLALLLLTTAVGVWWWAENDVSI
ncbi:MAG: hypothetical protein AB7H88_17490 [Vicinamibacterales bacterium]